MRRRYLYSPVVQAFLLAVFLGNVRAIEKETSLVTHQPIGALAVAGRLSIDLHAEFMLSRSWGTEAALNWYSCGYFGGGAGGTKVGGNFGDFGFQVPFAEREEKYPHAITVGTVPAIRFDGGDFLLGNITIEPKIVASRKMAVELWFRSGNAAPGDVILGWQSADGTTSSAPLVVPGGFKDSGNWRHLVVNCAGDRETWHLDGREIASGPRRMTVTPGHVMVLGGASSLAPSFKGELAAVRLHDETMTTEEIQHNFNGGVGLGTEIHAWWRLEPDKWWVKESVHFRHAVDKAEMAGWSEQQLNEFNQRVPGMFELAERAYDTYSERLALRSSVVSVKPEERGDGIKYNIPIQPNEGNVMGFDGSFGWSCQGAGFINPHELVHGWQVMTGNMAGNFWETHANFPQTYLGIYQTIPVIMAESPAFPSNGRTYYHDRLMFEHLAQSPAFGPMFISKLWYDGPTEEIASPYPWITFSKINPYKDRPLADEFTRMAMRNVTWEYKIFEEFKPGQPVPPEPREADENLYRKTAEQNTHDTEQALLRSRVVLEKIAREPGWWRVPKEQAPQQLGLNICPLTFTKGKVSAKLTGYVNDRRGSDWRAGFVGVDQGGAPVYGEVFASGETAAFDAGTDIDKLYLVVCAAPSKILDVPMTGDFRSFEQEQFPYKVRLTNCEPLDVLAVKGKPDVPGGPHKNGGGFVAKSAKVDPSVFVGLDARVLGTSQVSGIARVEGYASIIDSTVMDDAVVSGHALIYDHSTVSGHAKVRDHAVVKGRTTITGRSRILEHAVISTGKTCSGNVTAKGMASVYGGNQSGTAMIDGYYAKGNEITQGKWFTWSWGQGQNPGEIDENFGGLAADYHFNHHDDWSAWDSFGVTWGYLVNRPETGANGLRLNGIDQCVELPRDIADLANFTYTAKVTWDGHGDGGRIFEFSAENGDMMCLTPSADGRMVYAIRKGAVVDRLVAPALKKGTPAEIRVMMDGATASLYVDGAKVAEKRDMKLRPEDIRATRCYLGAGFKGDYFGGLIERFTVHSVALIDHTPPTPNPPSFVMDPIFTSPGSLVMAAARGDDPLGVVEYFFEEEGRRWTSEWNTDRTVRLTGRNAAAPLMYRFKMRDKNGNETAFSTPVRAGGFSKDTKAVAVPGDRPAEIEAEDFVNSVAGADGTARWEIQSQVPGFTGAGYVAVPDRGAVSDPFDPTAPRLDYAIKFAKAGTYFLWIRGNGNNGGGASIHAGFDMEATKWGTNLRTGFGKYTWSRSPAFEIAAPGGYLFSLWMREDGAMVDRFIITSSDSFVPDKSQTGTGPTASRPRSAR